MSTSAPALERAPQVELSDRDAWRRWLEGNHETATGVWLLRSRQPAGDRGLDYEAAVEEALCFGWIDGQAAAVDERRSKLYFAPRRLRSPWSRSNRERFQRMLEAGWMTPAGIAAAERARADGSWTVLDSAERLEVPADLAAALESRPPARSNWERFPPSARRSLLARIALARRPETRVKRIGEVAAAAQFDQRAGEPGRRSASADRRRTKGAADSAQTPSAKPKGPLTGSPNNVQWSGFRRAETAQGGSVVRAGAGPGRSDAFPKGAGSEPPCI